MIHIKLFEGFNTDDYYTEISPDEEDFMQQKTDEEDSKRVFKLLSNMLENSEYSIELRSWRNEIFISNRERIFRSVRVWVICTGDEYYNVRYDDDTNPPYGYYYKCDQIDGLKKLLKDKGIIK
jgi:predicted glutamine amidotransferase